MIVVEGPDGGGKTTLIQGITALTGLYPEKRVVDKDTNALVPLRDWVVGDMMSWPRAALYDRHRLISEPIYGPLMRRLNDGFQDLDWVSESFAKFYSSGPVIIYCLPPYEVVYNNVKRDPDNKAIFPHIKQIYDLYHLQAARDLSLGGFYTLHWDYTNDDLENFLKLLRTLLLNPINGRKSLYLDYLP